MGHSQKKKEKEQIKKNSRFNGTTWFGGGRIKYMWCINYNGALIKGCFQILAEKRKIFMPAMVLVIHGLFMHFYTNHWLIN